VNQIRKRAINKAIQVLLQNDGVITIEAIRQIANTFLKENQWLNRTQTKLLLVEMIEKGSK
jgi:hypothetical protein